MIMAMDITMPNAEQVTRVAELTPPGRAALATIRVRGPRALSAMAECFVPLGSMSLADTPIDRIRFGHWRGEEVVVRRVAADDFEVHCHGGHLAPRRVERDLVDAGCTCVDPWELILDGGDRGVAQLPAAGPCAQAALRLLVQAPTLRTALILLDQSQGALDDELERLVAAARCGLPQTLVPELDELVVAGRAGTRIDRPWRVALAGAPNVGKSSLANRLVGYERAIVDSAPGTTRDIVTTRIALDGWPCELWDTAGVRAATDELERLGVATARQAADEADLVLWVRDASRRSDGGEESEASGEFAPVGAEAGCPGASLRTIVVWNKIDLVDRSDARWSPTDGIPVSALTGEGIDALGEAIVARLVPSPPGPGAAVPFLEEQLAALIAAREAAARDDRDELLRALESLRRP